MSVTSYSAQLSKASGYYKVGWFAEIPEVVDSDKFEYHQFYVGKVSLNNDIMVFHNHFL